MFQLYFEKTYIIVVPTFKETLVHRHNMLHVFFGNGALQLSAGGKEICGNLRILVSENTNLSWQHVDSFVGAVYLPVYFLVYVEDNLNLVFPEIIRTACKSFIFKT